MSQFLSRREIFALHYDLRHGLRWWVNYGDGDEELTLATDCAGRHGLVRAYCPLPEKKEGAP